MWRYCIRRNLVLVLLCLVLIGWTVLPVLAQTISTVPAEVVTTTTKTVEVQVQRPGWFSQLVKGLIPILSTMAPIILRYGAQLLGLGLAKLPPAALFLINLFVGVFTGALAGAGANALPADMMDAKVDWTNTAASGGGGGALGSILSEQLLPVKVAEKVVAAQAAGQTSVNLAVAPAPKVGTVG